MPDERYSLEIVAEWGALRRSIAAVGRSLEKLSDKGVQAGQRIQSSGDVAAGSLSETDKQAKKTSKSWTQYVATVGKVTAAVGVGSGLVAAHIKWQQASAGTREAILAGNIGLGKMSFSANRI